VQTSRAVPLVAWVALAAGATAVGMATVSAVRGVVADDPVRVLTASEVDALLGDADASLDPVATLVAASSLPKGAGNREPGAQLDSREAGFAQADRGSQVPTNADDSPSRLGQDPGTLNGDTGDPERRSSGDRSGSGRKKATPDDENVAPAPPSTSHPISPGDPTATPQPSESDRIPAFVPSPSPTPTDIPGVTPSPSPTDTPGVTPSPSPTPTPSVVPSTTASPTPEPATPAPTSTSQPATPAPTSTTTPGPSVTPTVVPTWSASPQPTVTPPVADPGAPPTIPLRTGPAADGSDQPQGERSAVLGAPALAVLWAVRRFRNAPH
jgi:hypothetical protein